MKDIPPVTWCFTHRRNVEQGEHSKDLGCEIGPACYCGEDIYRGV